MIVSRKILFEAGILALVLVGIIWMFFFSGHPFHSPSSNAPNRAALKQIYETIQVGDSPATVRTTFERYASPTLSLHADRDSDWFVTMPTEWGASDWNLSVDFLDGKVASVKIRTADGPPPSNGPPDKQRTAN